MKQDRTLFVLFIVSIAAWAYCFRGFLLGKLGLTSDGLSYYEHIQFFIKSLAQGTYPLWDPYWNGGVPNEFFLRRLGSFNPFYLILVIMTRLGVPFKYGYLYFFSFYWILGALGFYGIARLYLKNNAVAFAAYLLLLFSSLSTRIFDSYLILVFTPMIWFFYFLMELAVTPRQWAMLGLTLSLMILLTTYIPLYFAVIFIVFAFFYIVFYAGILRKKGQSIYTFVRNHLALTIFCFVAVLASCYPGLHVFLQASNSEFVLPNRAYGANSSNILQVAKETVTQWAIMEELVYGWAFNDLRSFRFAIVYIPCFVFIIVFLGLGTRFDRKQWLLFAWGTVLFLLGSPGITPFYQWCSEHLFFFKYFRNLHFFLWLGIIPILILFLSEQLRQFLVISTEAGKRRIFVLLFVIVIHGGLLIYLVHQGNALWSTFAVMILSMIFFAARLFSHRWRREKALLVVLFVLIVLQPLEVYHYLASHVPVYTGPNYYDRIGKGFNFQRYQETYQPGSLQQPDPSAMYYSLRWYDFYFSHVDYGLTLNYERNRFYLYDNLARISDDEASLKVLEKALYLNANVVFLPSGKDLPVFSSPALRPAQNVRVIDGNTPEFQVTKFSPNEIKVESDLAFDQFLVYTDSYHSGWRATINGREVPLNRANVAFKGIFLPAGKNEVILSFGGRSLRMLNYSLLFLFYSVFILFVGELSQTRVIPKTYGQ